MTPTANEDGAEVACDATDFFKEIDDDDSEKEKDHSQCPSGTVQAKTKETLEDKEQSGDELGRLKQKRSRCT